MFLKLMIIFIFLIIFFYLRNITKLNRKINRKKKVFKAKKLITFNKNNLYSWMHLTKKERYNLSKQESVTYLDNRKVLLDEIRKEYKKISGGNTKKT